SREIVGVSARRGRSCRAVAGVLHAFTRASRQSAQDDQRRNERSGSTSHRELAGLPALIVAHPSIIAEPQRGEWPAHGSRTLPDAGAPVRTSGTRRRIPPVVATRSLYGPPVRAISNRPRYVLRLTPPAPRAWLWRPHRPSSRRRACGRSSAAAS